MLSGRAEEFRHLLSRAYFSRHHGDLQSWQASFDMLPRVSTDHRILNNAVVEVGLHHELGPAEHEALFRGLRGLHPWRKGPFRLFGLDIDTEWRSDQKWSRLLPALSSLRNRSVLDVGCGSGYHCWRMLGEGARFVLGIDPSLKFLYQFHAIKRFYPTAPVHYLPLKSEQFPAATGCFDTTFSMGVLYHRKSPFDHLEELRQTLRPGGELVLETLVVPGDSRTVFSPPERYAQMRNIWFIPSVHAAVIWLRKAGFSDVEVVNVHTTTKAEQRRTEWMRFLSLADFLDPEDSAQTLEGYPAPTRAILRAQRPW